MGSKRSASRTPSFTRRVKRDILTGGREGTTSPMSKAAPLLLGRLRRLEFAVLYLGGAVGRDFDWTRFEKSVILLEADAKIESRGRNLRRSEVQVPHEGGTRREAERAPEDLRRPESGDGQSSPFAPGPPDQAEVDGD